MNDDFKEMEALTETFFKQTDEFIAVMRRDGCPVCGTYPMTADCNGANCDR